MAKTRAETAQDELRQAVLAEHAATGANPPLLAGRAGVAVNTVRRWLEAARPNGPAAATS
jgi:transposase